jgi:multisubunit Na+/H+ antiporter MnhC subunit
VLYMWIILIVYIGCFYIYFHSDYFKNMAAQLFETSVNYFFSFFESTP